MNVQRPFDLILLQNVSKMLSTQQFRILLESFIPLLDPTRGVLLIQEVCPAITVKDWMIYHRNVATLRIIVSQQFEEIHGTVLTIDLPDGRKF